MAKEEEIVLWSDKRFYSVKFLPEKNILRYDIKIPLKQYEKGYVKSKAKQLKGLT